jgi:hypothetical protein
MSARSPELESNDWERPEGRQTPNWKFESVVSRKQTISIIHREIIIDIIMVLVPVGTYATAREE